MVSKEKALLTPAQKRAIVKKIQEKTRAFEAVHFSSVSKVSPRATKLAAKIKGKFGCYEAAIVELVQEITGEKAIPITTASSTMPYFEKFVAIVPLEVYGGHDYPKDRVAVSAYAKGHSNLIRENGTAGNNMNGRKDQVRCATDKEIAAMPNTQLLAVAAHADLIFV